MARTDYATLLTSTAFAAWWMVPRLAAFHAANPSIDLRLETVDRDVDIAAEVTTIAIRRGTGSWPGYESALIAPERLRAIGSPALLSVLGPFNNLESLLSAPLIHLDEPHRPRPTWRDFFDHFGINGSVAGDGLRLNDYALVLQAAMAGEGLALGWEHLCDRPFAQRLIQPVGEWTWDTGLNFYVIWSKTVSLSNNAKRTRDWIIAEASAAALDSLRLQPASDLVGTPTG
jgi:DNA-binding transcriptional LysR family regulator